MSGQNLLLLKFAALDLTPIILAGCRALLVVLDFHKLCMFNKKYYVTLKVGDASWRGSTYHVHVFALLSHKYN